MDSSDSTLKLCLKSPNSTNGSWWMVQIRPTDVPGQNFLILPTVVGRYFRSSLTPRNEVGSELTPVGGIHTGAGARVPIYRDYTCYCRLRKSLVMALNKVTRRSFLKQGVLSLAAFPMGTLLRLSRAETVSVSLEGRAKDLGNEIISFGLPLPFGFLNDIDHVTVISDEGSEIAIAVQPLERWRIGGREGSIRSLLIQFTLDFSTSKSRKAEVHFNKRAKKDSTEIIPVSKTLIDQHGLNGPRVLAILPAEWLCASEIVGPQTPMKSSGEYAIYDKLVESNFRGSLAYLDSRVYHEWLFDRTTC